MRSNLLTSRYGGNKNFIVDFFLLRSSRLLSRNPVTHFHCKLSFLVVACRGGKLKTVWAQYSSLSNRWANMAMLPLIMEVILLDAQYPTAALI